MSQFPAPHLMPRRAALSTLTLLGLALLLPPGAQAQELPILTVGFMAPLSGPLRGMGEEIRNAVNLNLVRTRPEFKALGFDLRFRAYDDTGSPEEGERLARELTLDRDVLALIGPVISGVALPVSEILAKARVGMLTSTSLTSLTGRGLSNVNRLIASEAISARAAVDFMKSTLSLRSVFVIDDGNSYGVGLAREVTEQLRDAGLQVLGSSSVQSSERITGTLERLRSLKPAAVYYAGEPDTALKLLRVLRRGGLDSAFFGGEALSFPSFLRAAGEDARGIYFTSAFAPAAAYPAAVAFRGDYLNTYKQPPSGVAILAHDAAEIVVEALKNAIASASPRSPSRAQVERALRRVRLEDLFTGSVAFDGRGERLSNTVFMIRIDEQGVPKVADVLQTRSRR